MNTLRLQKIDETDALYSLKSTGADLTDYREQLARERNARTLTLRRSQRPTIAQFLSKAAQSNQNRIPLIDSGNFPFLDPSYAISQLNTGNSNTLQEFLNHITSCAQQTPRLAQNLVKAPGVSEAFVNALSAGYSEQMIISIIRSLIVLFPIAGESMTTYVDDGLVMCLFDFLSSESVPLLQASIALTDVISEASGYARDSILCFNLHQFLIDVALSERDDQLTLQSCEALNKIFMNKQQIEPTILAGCVDQMACLLQLHNVQAVNTVLMCFVSMTNQMSALVFNLFDLNLFPIIVNMLSNQDLVSAALPLIGNLSVGHAAHIQSLLDNGLLSHLMILIDTEYTADVFWVLSNLVESVPHLTINLFSKDFIEKTVDIAASSSYEIEKEATFFLSTLIIFTETEDLIFFMQSSMLDLMIEMLGCGVLLIILRCLDALIRLSRAIEMKMSNSGVFLNLNGEFVEMFSGNEIHKRLSDLTDQKSNLIRERAEFLLKQIDACCPGDVASSLLAM
ncbi:hypothetical protein TRFO_33531 [Tritrichomonas foetus]|uniref:IBB domain-containing protein n=1 Tax=Tritrichomonas foetus TaxID=1144522 RepID=A0A1J4JQZ3_9EUKA|nr:hypothetical protein TRFO_33531 [Tritrichomonas foetus]|eukprot:OHS99931.1 hypothetical protein TRFO_33531 [Tritrichomonas foetus]